MRRCRLSVPVFATLVVSLFLFNVGAAQEDPIVPPGDLVIPQEMPAQMAFQPPPDADSSEDFVPPA